MNTDQQQVSAEHEALNTILDLIENSTEVRRTRKNSNSSAEKSEKFKYPNHDKSLYYEHEQFSAEHHFDCASMREMEDKSLALTLLITAITDQLVISDQSKGRALTADGFTKKYGDGEVIIDVKDACSKQTKGGVSIEKLTKQAAKLPSTQKQALADALLKELGYDSLEAFEKSTQKTS